MMQIKSKKHSDRQPIVRFAILGRGDLQRRIIGLRHRKAYLKVDQLTRNFHTSKDQLTQIAHRHPKQYFLDDENCQHKEGKLGNRRCRRQT